MAPSVTKYRFQNSLDMVAARSMRDAESTARSGTGNAWCIVDSPTLGRMPSVSKRFPVQQTEQPAASSSRLAMQAVHVAPLNIKKNRRKGFVSGIQLVLPPSAPASPLWSAPPSNLSTPQSALAFTAEWDLTQKTFVITPLDSPSPQSAASPRPMGNSVPTNVEEDPRPTSPTLSSPSVYTPSILIPHPDLPALQHPSLHHTEVSAIDLTTDEDDAYSTSCAGTPVSSIFDREIRYSHSRNISQSTTASSMYSTYEKDGQHSDGEDALVGPVEDDETGATSGMDQERDQPWVLGQDSWASPRTDAQLFRQETGQEPSLRNLRKPLPDLPCDTSSSYFDMDASDTDLSTTGKSFRRQLSAQISKAFTSTPLFKRSAHGQL